MPTSHGFLSRLLDFGRFGRGLHIPYFFRWRQNRLQAESLKPKLPAPALAVVDVLVFLVFDLAAGFQKGSRSGTLSRLGTSGQELPVLMVLRLGEHDALAGDYFGTSRVAQCLSLIHGGDKGLTDASHDIPTGHLNFASAKFLHQGLHNLDMPVSLLEVFGPFVLEILVSGAGQRGFIDFNAT
jgi:hypothetical protein